MRTCIARCGNPFPLGKRGRQLLRSWNAVRATRCRRVSQPARSRAGGAPSDAHVRNAPESRAMGQHTESAPARQLTGCDTGITTRYRSLPRRRRRARSASIACRRGGSTANGATGTPTTTARHEHTTIDDARAVVPVPRVVTDENPPRHTEPAGADTTGTRSPRGIVTPSRDYAITPRTASPARRGRLRRYRGRGGSLRRRSRRSA